MTEETFTDINGQKWRIRDGEYERMVTTDDAEEPPEPWSLRAMVALCLGLWCVIALALWMLWQLAEALQGATT